MKFKIIQNRKDGFTLVELAIVITIIGILIGGVLKGQQLIEQAKLAATISQASARADPTCKGRDDLQCSECASEPGL